MTKLVKVSRPTFAELATAVRKAGLADLFDEDGSIRFESFIVAADNDTPSAARLAAAIADAASLTDSPHVYEDAKVRITTRCRQDGVHLVETRQGQDPSVIVLPKQSLFLVAGDLIDCMARPTEAE